MKNTLRLLSIAALLTMGAATAMASSGGSLNSEKVTGTQLGTQEVGRPASHPYNPGYSQYTAGTSAQSSAHPGAVGPTGSKHGDGDNDSR